MLVQVAATSQGQRSIACLRTRRLTGVVFTAQTTVTGGSHWIQAVGHQRWTFTPAVDFAVHALARLTVVVPAFATAEDLHSILLMEAHFSAATSDAAALRTAVLLVSI